MAGFLALAASLASSPTGPCACPAGSPPSGPRSPRWSPCRTCSPPPSRRSSTSTRRCRRLDTPSWASRGRRGAGRRPQRRRRGDRDRAGGGRRRRLRVRWTRHRAHREPGAAPLFAGSARARGLGRRQPARARPRAHPDQVRDQEATSAPDRQRRRRAARPSSPAAGPTDAIPGARAASGRRARRGRPTHVHRQQERAPASAARPAARAAGKSSSTSPWRRCRASFGRHRAQLLDRRRRREPAWTGRDPPRSGNAGGLPPDLARAATEQAPGASSPPTVASLPQPTDPAPSTVRRLPSSGSAPAVGTLLGGRLSRSSRRRPSCRGS